MKENSFSALNHKSQKIHLEPLGLSNNTEMEFKTIIVIFIPKIMETIFSCC